MGDSLNQLCTFYYVFVPDLACFCCRIFEGTFSVLDEWWVIWLFKSVCASSIAMWRATKRKSGLIVKISVNIQLLIMVCEINMYNRVMWYIQPWSIWGMLLLGLYSLDCKDSHVVSSNNLRPKRVISQNIVFHYCKHDFTARNCYIFGSSKMNNSIVWFDRWRHPRIQTRHWVKWTFGSACFTFSGTFLLFWKFYFLSE